MGLDIPLRATAPRRAKVPVVLLAVILASGALVAPWVGRWTRAGAPFRPSEMNLGLDVSLVPVSELQSAIEGFGVTPDQLRAMQPMSLTQEAIVGQLTFGIPRRIPSGSKLALFVMDERSHRLTQWASGWASGGGSPVSGYDGIFAGFATRYPWLNATAPIFQGGSYTDPGMAIVLPHDIQGPLTFYAALDPAALPVSDVTHDVSVTLGFVGPDGQIWWAQHVTPNDSSQ
jgi:hypothetical protein